MIYYLEDFVSRLISMFKMNVGNQSALFITHLQVGDVFNHLKSKTLRLLQEMYLFQYKSSEKYLNADISA